MEFNTILKWQPFHIIININNNLNGRIVLLKKFKILTIKLNLLENIKLINNF